MKTLLIVAIAFALSACSDAPAENPVQVAKISEAAKAEAAKKELAYRKVVLILRALKKSQRDPDSLVWEDISATEDASVMCINYRSRNGFGGMNKSFLVVADKKASDKPAAWNKHCARKHFNDFNYAAYGV